jgi:hypothetical protein
MSTTPEILLLVNDALIEGGSREQKPLREYPPGGETPEESDDKAEEFK